MRVLLTTPYDLEVPGGVNRHARGLQAALRERGIDARLLGPSSDRSAPDEPHVVRLGRVAVGGFNGARSRVTLDLGIGAPVRRLIREFQPDVVHLQEPFLPTLNSWVLAYAGSARRVGTFHTYSETSCGYLWAWPWCRWTNAQLDARVAVSRPALEFAARYHPAAYTVVPHGVVLPEPGNCRPSRPPGRPVRILFVGRADEPRKGFPVLAEAMRILEQRAPGEFVLEAVGPATARGPVSDAELSACYQAADICAVPSLGGESFGLVALEALAHGVPVVAADIAGYREWLAGAAVGGLVRPADPGAMADRLLGLGRNAEELLQCAVRARNLASTYGWRACVERLNRLYEGREA